jgi:biotin carboxylase
LATDSVTEYKYTIGYQYADYSGSVVVWAEDSEQAVARAKRKLAPHMSLPMAYESYRVEKCEPA